MPAVPPKICPVLPWAKTTGLLSSYSKGLDTLNQLFHQKASTAETCYTKQFLQQEPLNLHKAVFAPEDFYPETVYNKLLSHRKTVTPNSFSTRRPYTRNSLHQTPPTSEAVYTKQFLHENPVTATSSFCTNSRLHQTAGWTKKDTCASLRNILSLKVHFRRIKKQ